MIRFKVFMAVWFSVIAAVSVFAVVVAPRLENRDNGTLTNHFSVVWKGFAPDYCNKTPDYYVCINNLKEDTLEMKVALRIENFENSSYYFTIEKHAPPPSGWDILNQTIGRINVDTIHDFIYTGLRRLKPAAIPEGRITESVELDVKAYYDSEYTSLYSKANFTIRFHLIDLTSPTWTVLDKDNFDNGTTEGWYGYLRKYEYWRSYPYAMRNHDGTLAKTFDISGQYNESYLIFAAHGSGYYSIYFNNVKYFQNDYSVPSTWVQIAIPLPLGASTTVKINANCYIDDVYVIAK